MANESRGDRRRTDSLARAKLSRAVWRWHFFAGMLVAPVLVVAATTGALYVFRAELEPLIYPQMRISGPSRTALQPVSYEQQAQAAKSAVPPDSELLFLVAPKPIEGVVRRTTLFRYKLPDKDQRFVFVDPFTGQVSGTIARSQHLFEVLLKIHRQLFAGTIGRVLVELATSWTIVLVLSGLYLWMPKFGRWKGAGVWWPRLSGSRYQVLRDLHAVPAAYLSFVMLAVLVTGLFFSSVWGLGYRAAAFATGGFPTVFTAPPKSTIAQQPSSQLQKVTIDQAVRTMRDLGYTDCDLSVSPPHDEEETFSVSAKGATGASVHGLIHLDRYTGEVLYNSHGKPLPWMTVGLLYALPIHQGSVLGMTTKVLAFVAAVGLIALVVTAAWMWWTRRPSGKLGLPRKHEGVQIPKWMLTMIAALGLLLPVAGLSLLLVLIGEYGWTLTQRAYGARRDTRHA